MSMGVRVCIPSLFSQTWTSLCYSHINQKTQFENPVLEAKKKLSQETAAIQQAAAAPSQGNIAECTPLFNFHWVYKHFPWCHNGRSLW